jgi:hypothetical protein
MKRKRRKSGKPRTPKKVRTKPTAGRKPSGKKPARRKPTQAGKAGETRPWLRVVQSVLKAAAIIIPAIIAGCRS